MPTTTNGATGARDGIARDVGPISLTSPIEHGKHKEKRVKRVFSLAAVILGSVLLGFGASAVG